MQLRNAKGLNRLVYISCSPASAIKNWVDLQRPCSKSMKGDPFVAKLAVAVDMFPHTPHTELVILFEREVEKMQTDNTVEDVVAAENSATAGTETVT
jgi:tRNA (uracil-5-)-methyltransferase